VIGGSQILRIVRGKALHARAAGPFLPLFGPVPGDATIAPTEELLQRAPEVEYSFRASERFVLPARDHRAIAQITP
jgi:hypothetical protein